jgi:NifB/MoaA-like Fe-S oxidoreductase
VIEALRGRDLGDVVFLPRAMFDASGELTLDDMSPAAIGKRLGSRVEVAGMVGEVVDSLCLLSEFDNSGQT